MRILCTNDDGIHAPGLKIVEEENVAELTKRAPGATILVQVNTSGEDGKGGCPPADVSRLVAEAGSAATPVQTRRLSR